MEKPLVVSSSPHLHCGLTTQGMMLDVLIAMIPAAAASLLLFGWRAGAVMLVCVAACVASEYLTRLILKRPQTVGDLSAVVTGMLLAFNLPSTIPFWQAAFGSVVAIVVVKQLFGGLGYNFANPALVGRIVMMSSFGQTMTKWTAPLQTTIFNASAANADAVAAVSGATSSGVDALASATPLAQLGATGETTYSTLSLLFGLRPGSLGETCVIALLLGGIYLIVRRIISPLVPVIYIGTVFILAWILGENPVAQILSGGLVLGAVFMATDYATSPLHKNGKIVFAIGCGILTIVIRLYSSLPEGVSFAILIMNILTPLIERYTRPIPFGMKRRVKNHG